MKKTLFILTAMLLFIGAAFAQPRTATRVATTEPEISLKAFAAYAPQSRSTIYSEGFESTTNTQSGSDACSGTYNSGALPDGWTVSATGKWKTYANIAGMECLSGSTAPNNGSRMMANSWINSGSNWAFSAGFALEAGNTYTITFAYNASGYPDDGETDDFEVKIGTTATAAGMSVAESVFSQNGVLGSGYWENATKTFTPATSGTYYLGFHDMRPAQYGLAIMIDDILITAAAPPPCDPATNLEVVGSATENHLTWVLPAGETNVNIYRDDALLVSNVAGTSYDDLTNLEEITCYTVEVNCTGGGVSIKSNQACVTLSGDCDPATNFAVKLNTSDCTAELTWNAPAKGRSTMLWDNTNINTLNYGQASVWWTGGNNGRVAADDFDVTSIWTIETITTQAFFQSSAAPGPVTMGIKIYTDNGGEPGTEIYSNTALPFTTSSNIYTIQLPTAFEIATPGKYWIGIFGVYNTATPTSQAEFDARHFFVYYGSNPFGDQMKLKDYTGSLFGEGANWHNVASGAGGAVISMYFAIEGTKEALPVDEEFNIYRDGTLIEANLNALTYTDEGFDAYAGHKWEVKVACSGGGESAPVSKSVDACKTCKPATNLKVAVEANCSLAKLTWNAPEAGLQYKIYRDGEFVEQVATNSYEDTDLEPGTHIWEVKTVCGSVESGVVSVTGSCVSVKENATAAFSIVPNPAKDGNVTITSGSNFNKIEVISFLGQTILSQVNAGNSVTLDVSTLPSGVYFVRIASEQGVNVQKFVKQ